MSGNSLVGVPDREQHLDCYDTNFSLSISIACSGEHMVAAAVKRDGSGSRRMLGERYGRFVYQK